MTFRRTRGAHLYFRSVTRWCMPFVHNLKQFTCLRKLKFEAFSYSERGLDVLDQLESLEVGAYPGFDAKSLADCCQTMKKLRYLNFGQLIPKISKNNFEILVTNCQQLERLAFGVELLDSTVPYELVCQLPKLRHLQVWHGGSLRESFIEGLINKLGSPLESLILKGHVLKEAQVQHLCNISTVKELDIFCDTLPFADLLKLKNLIYFHISSPMTEDQLLHLPYALPRVKVLNSQFCPELYVPFLTSVRNWVNEQRKQRGRIKIRFGFRAKPVISYANLFVKIIEGRLGPILINKELKIQMLPKRLQIKRVYHLHMYMHVEDACEDINVTYTTQKNATPRL
ncbi:uncharacterized protein LOC108154389 [Drosophila miranda]|uniref:uncharacterized protein LOC108154389 n=1 Tax=Drosophila miranda TaxID=7229 RepID=UPI00143F4831|nr:uncharacterized protein LOC108154389 [Drosophila miranda]